MTVLVSPPRTCLGFSEFQQTCSRALGIGEQAVSPLSPHLPGAPCGRDTLSSAAGEPAEFLCAQKPWLSSKSGFEWLSFLGTFKLFLFIFKDSVLIQIKGRQEETEQLPWLSGWCSPLEALSSFSWYFPLWPQVSSWNY